MEQKPKPQPNNVPLGTQLKIWGKLSTILAIAFLSYHGAIAVKDKAHWGSSAMASEGLRADAYNRAENRGDLALKPAETLVRALGQNTDYIDSKAVAVPQGLEPIKIELTDSEKAGLAKCKKTKPVNYCNGLWGV